MQHLWPTFPGSKANGSSLLAKPSGPDPTKKFMGVFLVPQRMYMADGTLADQVTYPLRIKKEDRTKEDEAKMFEQLKLVGIEYLVARNEKDVSELIFGEGTCSIIKLRRGCKFSFLSLRSFTHQPFFPEAYSIGKSS